MGGGIFFQKKKNKKKKKKNSAYDVGNRARCSLSMPILITNHINMNTSIHTYIPHHIPFHYITSSDHFSCTT